MEFARKNKSKKKGHSVSSPKVVYISSPMKVSTTASRFRSLVQQLTGRDSDITSFMDTVQSNNICPPGNNSNYILPQIDYNNKSSKSVIRKDDQQLLPYISSLDGNQDSPTTSSGSLIEQSSFGGEIYVNLEVEDQYLQDVFSSGLFLEPSQEYLLGCSEYDAVKHS